MSSPSSLLTWVAIWRWPLQAQVLAPVAIAAVAHLRGRGAADGRWRAASFYAGLALLVLALQSPMDTYSGRSFAWHMVQHMFLLLVIPPLVLAGQPWARMFNGLPSRLQLRLRVIAGGWLGRQGTGDSSRRAPGWRRRVAALPADPLTALIAFVCVLWGWHVPVLFDAALRDQVIHDVEHLWFLAAGMLYWSRVIASAPFPAPLEPGRRVPYLLAGLGACWVLGIVITFAVAPLYVPYLQVAGASYSKVMASQVAGGAIMWGPSMAPFDVLIAISIQQWLSASSHADEVAEAAART
ncbi:MAG: cytochrome c oxidase assembly protein [Acidimicrobiales bacterium]